MATSILLLIMANVFITIACYGHLNGFRETPIVIVIFVRWGIAFIEYCFQVPANRLGSQFFSWAQLKVVQEGSSLVVFAGFNAWYLKIPVAENDSLAGISRPGSVYFVFSDKTVVSVRRGQRGSDSFSEHWIAG